MKLCLYGKATGRWERCFIRKTNGAVAFTPRNSDPWWMKVPMIPFKTPKPKGAFATFTKTLGSKPRLGFG